MGRRGVMAFAIVLGIALAAGPGAAAVATAEEPPGTGAATGPTLVDQLAEAAAGGAAGAAELAAATGLSTEGPGSLVVDADGRVGATLSYATPPTEADRARAAELAEVTGAYAFGAALTVNAAPERLPELAALPGVVSVAPHLAPAVGGHVEGAEPSAPPIAAACSTLPVDADLPQRTAAARERFGVDGSGVTVGIISDSFAAAADAPTTAEQDIAAGALPGPGNPCGRTTPVRVLSDPDTGTDEGRAMAQLVHGIAPGAELLFAGGGDSRVQMANAILELAAAGADVIVDDLGFIGETAFQPGILSVAINTVVAQGVAYYTAFGNDTRVGAAGTPSAGKPITSLRVPAFRGTACPDWVEGPSDDFDCLDFDPGDAQDATDTFFYATATHPGFSLDWAEPTYGVTSSFTLELYQDAGDGPQRVGAGAVIDDTLPFSYLWAPEAVEGETQLVVVRDRTVSTAAPALWINQPFPDRSLAWTEYDESSGGDVVGVSTFGHAVDSDGVSVGAAYHAQPDVAEPYSSVGPAELRFPPMDPWSTVPAEPLPQPVVVHGPVLTAADGGRTTFFGRPVTTDGGSGYAFHGTSAAAPDAAAAHALALQYAPGTAPAAIVTEFVATAQPMRNELSPWVADRDRFGAGMIDAEAALGRLPAAAVTGLAATALSPTDLAIEWDASDAAAEHAVDVLADGAVISTSTVTGATSAVSVTGLQPDRDYVVRVTARNDAGEDGGTAETTATTPVPAAPGGTPSAPSPSELDPQPQPGLTATPATVTAGGSVTVSGLPSRAFVHGWFFSEPVSAGWAWTGRSGEASFPVPTSLGAGAHRLALYAEDGSLLGWVALEVVAAPVPAGPPAGSLAATGLASGPVASGLAAALALLGAGAVVTAAAGRRRRAER